MKNTNKLLLILMLVLLILPEIVSAQRRSRRRIIKEEPRTRIERPTDYQFIKSIYAGAYINSPRLGRSGNTGFFQAGIKPFAGYEFNEWLSAGPILSFNYYYQWNTQAEASAYDMSVAIFVRTLFLDRLYLQGELGYNRFTNIHKQSASYPTTFVGAGWVFEEDVLRSEVSLMFDISGNSRKQGAFPFDYRLGFHTTF